MTDFYYAIGRIRSLETYLLSGVQLGRMAAAADLEAALAVLAETLYAENITHISTPAAIEELCDKERATLKALLENLAPGNPVLAVLLKSANSQDQAYFLQLKTVLGKVPSPLIQKLAKQMIDRANLTTLLRTQTLKVGQSTLKGLLMEGGFIDRDLLLAIADKTPQEIASRLNFTIYFPYLLPGIEFFSKNRSLFLLEKLMDDFMLQGFRRAKYLGCGIEPLVGFWLAKEAEIKTLRFILICKMQSIDPEEIRERLRVNY
ncbi:MAG: V-type ATPase subunit [Candidatus Aenigmarchaeota archaeon]|nr:V-type ATPase subunit [Candidatus Aenigmarchaeota archaeon]